MGDIASEITDTSVGFQTFVQTTQTNASILFIYGRFGVGNPQVSGEAFPGDDVIIECWNLHVYNRGLDTLQEILI